jgi:uncharacterized membrane protein
MGKGRLEAFSDGVIAILITIMVLELKVPHGSSLEALNEVWPILLCYLLSFLYIAIYWNNHHHMLHAVRKVDGAVLWANMHLLFWLSLVPFMTSWMGENHFETLPVALYGVVLFMAGLAYFILERSLLRIHSNDAPLAVALGDRTKDRLSIVLYLLAIGLAFVNRWIAIAIYAAVALIWLIPDRRIERVLKD